MKQKEYLLNKQPQFIRWYDKYDNICALINLSRDLPLTVQENIGTHMLHLIQDYHDLLGWDKELKSVGSEAVLSLYKSKRKLRWYDKVPSLHRAYSHLAILPEDILQECDSRFQPVVDYIEKHRKSYFTSEMAETIYSYINPRYGIKFEFREDDWLIRDL